MWTSEVHISQAVVFDYCVVWTGLRYRLLDHAYLANLQNASPFMAFPPSMLPGFDRVGARLF